jgi:ABC-type branched-subunit amino acid transport system substrate-binding protein
MQLHPLISRRLHISSNDVEKRWHDPRAFRFAVAYATVVVIAAAVAFLMYATGDRESIPRAVATPTILFVGSVGAFGKTYVDWRAGRAWPIWQGAGWFLIALAVVSLGIPAMGLLS